MDELISDFLEEIGVTHEQFFETVANNLDNNNINSFVVSSILTVEDFIQFKAMMVKRNIDLTNQVGSLVSIVRKMAGPQMGMWFANRCCPR